MNIRWKRIRTTARGLIKSFEINTPPSRSELWHAVAGLGSCEFPATMGTSTAFSTAKDQNP